MLRLEHINKTYATGEVLKDVTWEVKAGDRIGLVGVNGAGKSTQLKIIMGLIEPTAGEIIRPASLQIGYLTQEFDVEPTFTVKKDFWTVFSQANELSQSIEKIYKQMENADPKKLNKLVNQLDRLQREFEGLDGYSLESRIEKTLVEMGFAPADGDRLVSTFSGGWQMRLSLGKIILQQPDILLLDEPTNHLDLETIEWLENYLKGLNTPMVIISHDREFLDRLTNQIVETERGVSTTYLGNYSSYLEQKAFNNQIQLSSFERQQKEIKRQQDFVDRFRASATRATQAQSREKQLEKIDRIEAPIANLKTLRFKFPPASRSGLEVVSINNLVHFYDEKILFLGAKLSVERGDRIAFLGPNGCGKSTLLRLIMGIEEAAEGSIKLGQHNIQPAYFEQNQAEALDLEKTVLETIHDEVPDWKNEEVRSLLGCFLFSGDTVFKKVESLSGGEKARLALAKMLLQPANLLVLDEPTNHLDIPAKEMLEASLKEYEGTVLIVSHDRYFISQVANKIVEVRNGELLVYAGDYHYYQDKLLEEKLKSKKERIDSQKKANQKKTKARSI
jgi:ATP-binding cassette subfamily F protein 3